MVAVERGRNLALPAHDSSLGGGAASSANGDFDGAPAQPPAPYVTQLLSYVLIYLSTYLPPPPLHAGGPACSLPDPVNAFPQAYGAAVLY